MALKKHSICGNVSRFPHDVARHVQVLDRLTTKKKGRCGAGRVVAKQ